MSNATDDTVSYAAKGFLEKVLKGHDRVTGFKETSHRTYTVDRQNGASLSVYITGKYIFSEADLSDVLAANPGVNCILLGAAWNRYTDGAKGEATLREIGLFSMGEFMGALNYAKHWVYVPKKK